MPIAWVHWLRCYAVWFHSYRSGLDKCRNLNWFGGLFSVDDPIESINNMNSAGYQGDRPNHLPG